MQITISEHQVTNYEHERTPTAARLISSKTWTTEEGQTILGDGNVESSDFYKETPASLSNGVVTIEAFEDVDCNVVDAVEVGGLYTLALYDADGHIVTIYSALKVPDTLSPQTWGEVLRYSRARRVNYSTTVASLEQLYAHAAQYSSLATKANTAEVGVIALSDAPDDVNFPVALGENSPKLPDTLANHSDSLLQAVLDIDELGNPDRILTITGEYEITGDVTVPANITLDFGNNGFLDIKPGTTVTINSMKDPGNRQVFGGAESGANVFFGRGAAERFNIAWLCGAEAHDIDATRALDLVLESCSLNDGGRVYIPERRYISSGGHVIPKATRIEGSGDFITIGYGGTAITLTDPTDDFLFKIGQTTYDTELKHLTLEGGGVGTALLMEGSGLVVGASSGKCVVEQVTFSNFEYGINFNTLSSGNTWQMAQIALNNCRWVACPVGVRQSSVNSSWAFDNCNFYIPTNGWAMVAENGGITTFKSCEFAGAGTNDGCVWTSGSHVAFDFIGCQEEGTTQFIYNTGSDISGVFNLYGNLIQSKIQLNASCVVNSFGNNYLSKTFKFGGVGTLCYITSIGDHIQNRDVADGTTPVNPPQLTEGGVNNVHVITEDNGISDFFAKRLTTRFISPLVRQAETAPLVEIGNIHDGGMAYNRALLWLGKRNADESRSHGYNIYRSDVTGYLNFDGTQADPFKAFAFNAALFIPDEAYDATTWNNNLSVPSKNAIRDEIENVKTTKASLSGATFTGGVAGTTAAFSGAATAGTLAVGAGTTVTKILKGTVSINPASIAATTYSSQTFTLTGAVAGDTLTLNPPALTSGLIVASCFVSGADTITVNFYNTTGSPIDEAAGTWTYLLIRS